MEGEESLGQLGVMQSWRVEERLENRMGGPRRNQLVQVVPLLRERIAEVMVTGQFRKIDEKLFQGVLLRR